VNPDAEELTLNDVDLLRALGAIKKNIRFPRNFLWRNIRFPRNLVIDKKH
jgi:hypothetical protein